MDKILAELIIFGKMLLIVAGVLLIIWFSITGQGDPCGPMDATGC